MESRDSLREIEVDLPGGILELTLTQSAWPLERLCGFATRRNPKRPFLIVSKVLGRHVPARPAEMRASVRALARLVPSDLPNPILAIGLAETAVALGQSLFEELAAAGHVGGFIHSTRQVVDHPLLCRFEEPHSHASAHLIYRPADTTISLPSVRTLLLVDDEVSTGTTLFNLAAALMPALPRCERILVATLTDWTGSAGWLRRMPRDAECVTLLSGRLRWRGAEGELTAPPACPQAQALGTLSSPGSFGRVGIAAGSAIPAFDAKLLALPPQSQIRLVGTGEFTYPPFLLGEQLERAGHDVLVQATSRSPVRTGGIVACGLKFDDNYGSGAPNFLYNAGPSGGRLSFVCHETAPGTLDPQLLKALDARALYFGAD